MVNEAVWQLERRNGELTWAGCSLRELALTHGTPLYVVNADLLAHSHAAICRPFEAEGLEARTFFSYKTNPVPSVLRRIRALGCGAEVISEFEFWIARRLGLRGEDIVVNGPAKSRSLLREAVAFDAALINVESLEELRLLQEVAAQCGRRARLGFRVNPCLSTSRFDFTLSSGTRSSHAGFRRADPAWQEALRLARDDSRLDLRGLQFHIGSGVRSPRPYVESLKTALVMWNDLLKMGFQPSVLDIGGGFAAPTLKEFNLLEAVRFFGWNRPPAMSAVTGQRQLPARIAREFSRVLRGFAHETGLPVPVLYLEPGRALVAASQLLLLTVVAVRSRPRGLPVAICDAGAMSISPLLLSERHAVVSVSPNTSRPDSCYDIVGNLPAPLDLVALHQALPILAPGDVIAVMDVGAYFTSLGNNFAGPRPPIVMIEHGRPTLARLRETFSGMVERDVEGFS